MVESSGFWVAAELVCKSARDGCRSVRSAFGAVGALVDTVITPHVPVRAAEDELVASEEANEALEPWWADSIFRSGGQTSEMGPRPRLATSHAALCACGHWLHPGAMCSCGCTNVRLKTPVAMQGAERNPSAGEPPSSAEADSLSWHGWAVPAILDALAEHRPYQYHQDGFVWCLNSAGHNHATHGDWTLYDWREHVAPLIADRIACDPARAAAALQHHTPNK